MNLPDNLEVLFSSEEIEKAIDRVAVRLNIELRNTRPVFVCVMQGGLPFTWDLMRRVNLDIELDFVRARRYVGTTGQDLSIERDVTVDLKDKTVVLIDDILDAGVTLHELTRIYLQTAQRVLTCVLVNKEVHRDIEIQPDFEALRCPNAYIVGRGMDFEGRFRQLASIYELKEHC